MIDPFEIFRYRNIKSERIEKDTMQIVSKKKLLGLIIRKVDLKQEAS